MRVSDMEMTIVSSMFQNTMVEKIGTVEGKEGVIYIVTDDGDYFEVAITKKDRK